MKKQRAERLDSSRLNLCRHFHLIEEEEEELASLPCHCCYQTTLSEVQFLGWKNVHISLLSFLVFESLQEAAAEGNLLAASNPQSCQSAIEYHPFFHSAVLCAVCSPSFTPLYSTFIPTTSSHHLLAPSFVRSHSLLLCSGYYKYEKLSCTLGFDSTRLSGSCLCLLFASACLCSYLTQPTLSGSSAVLDVPYEQIEKCSIQ